MHPRSSFSYSVCGHRPCSTFSLHHNSRFMVVCAHGPPSPSHDPGLMPVIYSHSTRCNTVSIICWFYRGSAAGLYLQYVCICVQCLSNVYHLYTVLSFLISAAWGCEQVVSCTAWLPENFLTLSYRLYVAVLLLYTKRLIIRHWLQTREANAVHIDYTINFRREFCSLVTEIFIALNFLFVMIPPVATRWEARGLMCNFYYDFCNT